jgi:hypothetical protein
MNVKALKFVKFNSTMKVYGEVSRIRHVYTSYINLGLTVATGMAGAD